ncbi:hypothetical protein PACTADRAFT_47907 [Pachysolen tannophilus NRRL Y-2460]|uniref:Protein HIR n=1 Tax=Pachysolen tannophilus NRRL Y-2460 TaxID=669874 RepID=A0A1E4U266_PACTA|nr:hypothetical protein PACTADRAFT_47907 [Pachysolen tannophilus NRRL Y-2460]
MHILKLPWLTHTEEHKKFEVYSLSVSPDGSRLASGGLDGKIRIWSTESIVGFTSVSKNENDLNLENSLKTQQQQQQQQQQKQELPLENENALRRPLCSMGRHTGAVTCVRFSPSGRFLASGSDDRILLIWEKDEEAGLRPKALGEQDADLEHWVVRKRLAAHDNDIQDMAWAPDSSILVTVGLDRSIIIWNGNTFEKIKRYDIHQSHVKGIVFDPANKYFITASDDRTVRVFRYHKTSPTEMTFSIEHIVTEPFKKSPLTTYFRRPSWSPDGQHIAVPNAKNGPVSSVAIINRGSWDSDISLIGHDSPCEVVAFSPRLFEIKDNPNDDPKISTVIATAGQDKKLAIWNTSRARPLFVADEICYKTVTDLAWSPNGDILYLSSLDGTITVVCFEENELGIAVPLKKNEAQLHRYGADRETMILPESVEALILEEKAKKELEKEKKELNDKNNSIEKSETLIQQFKPKPQQITSTPKKPLSPSTINGNLKLTPKKLINKLNAQKITITKSGKKRVAPMLVSSSSNAFNSNNKLGSNLLSSSSESKKNQKNLAKDILSTTPYMLPRLGLETTVSGLRNRFISEAQQEESDDDDIDTIEHTIKKPHLHTRITTSKKSNNIEYPEYLAHAALLPTRVFTDLKIQPLITVTLSLPSKLSTLEEASAASCVIIEIRNSNDDCPTKIISNDAKGNRKFELFLPDKIIHAVGYQDKFWAIATETGSIKVYTANGTMLLPSIELGLSISILTCNKECVACLTSNGLVSCWNIFQKCKILDKVSVAPILNHSSYLIQDETTTTNNKRKISKFAKIPNILECQLNKDGIPIVTLDNDQVFAYSTDLKTWVKLIDPWYIQNDQRILTDKKDTLLDVLENRIKQKLEFNSMCN